MPKSSNLDVNIVKKLVYEGYSSKDIAENYGCHRETVFRFVRKNNIKWPRNEVKHDFFKTWNEHMAYILGFITADGCVSDYKPYLSIDLKCDDVEILEYIKKNVHPTANFYTYKRKHKNGKYYQSSKIMIYSREILSDLEKFSIFPNKTGKHKLNYNIPEEYLRDFIRGFFDGDGSVYYRGGLINSSFCCASESFIDSIYKILRYGTKEVEYKKEDSPALYKIKLFYEDSLKLRDLMYYDGCFCLQRKYTRFMNPNKKIYKTKGGFYKDSQFT